MKTPTAHTILFEYFNRRYKSFQLKERLSDFSHTYRVTADRNNYVVKLIQPRNLVSRVQHNPAHNRALLKVATRVDANPRIRSITVVDSVIHKRHTIFLLKAEHLTLIKNPKLSTICKLSRAIADFHASSTGVTFQRLPWNHIPAHLIRALRENDRWKEIGGFFARNERLIAQQQKSHVSCHNDIHAGNVFLCEDQIVFLDLDDMCTESYFNDLGMVISNFTDSSYSFPKLERTIKKLLISYGASVTQKSALVTCLFALRKLYLAEAYFLYLRSVKRTAQPFVHEVRKRQRLVTSLVESYL